MQFLRENLLLMTVYMLIFWSNDWLMNRIMKGGNTQEQLESRTKDAKRKRGNYDEE